ncbi:nuclear body protein SP140-like [Pimephales promelas]|nr:nuclear body protein SP140-like [Pimephales promelas]
MKLRSFRDPHGSGQPFRISLAERDGKKLPDLTKMNVASVTRQKPECELKENCSETDFRKDERMKRYSNIFAQNTDVFQEVRDKKQLVVRCGNMSGSLHRVKYDTGEKCISCKGKWYSPREFEVIGGKGSHKRWRFNIYYRPSKGFQQVQLLKLIKSGVLPEFGHLRKSFRRVTQKDKRRANSVQNLTRKNELMHALKGFPESWKRLFAKTVSIPVCGIKKDTLQRETIRPDSSSDESESVAGRVKLNRRESVVPAETFSKNTTDSVGSTASDKG